MRQYLKKIKTFSGQPVLALVALAAFYVANRFKLSPSGQQYMLPAAGLLVLIAAGYSWLTSVARRRHLQQVFARGNVPHLGNARLFSGNLRETFFKPDHVFRIHEFHKELGSTFGLIAGPDPMIQTTDLELLKRVFVTEGAIHVDKTELRLPFPEEITESIIQSRGDKWRHARRVIAPAFHQRQMKADNVYGDMDVVGEQFIEFLASCQASAGPGPFRLDVHYALRNYSLELMLRVAFGRSYKTRWVQSERNELLDMIHDAEHLFYSFIPKVSVMFPFLQHFLSQFVRFTKLGACLAKIHSILEESFQARRKQKATQQNRKMIDSIIESSIAGKMIDKALKANLFFLMMAGHETSSFFMTHLLFRLAWLQDKQDKLRRELQTHGEGAEYLEWCIQEMLRCHSPAPSAIGRILEHDIEHKGMRFFKGTSINASIWSIHYTERYWGDDVDEFRPERWGEPVDEEKNPGINLRQFAFGYGPRVCPGQSLALAEVRNLIARLLVRYKVSLSPNTPHKLHCTSPNLYHWIIHHPVELEFTTVEGA